MFFQGVMLGSLINFYENNNFNANLNFDTERSSETLSNVVLFQVSATIQHSTLLETL
jgi:hypothetical protein